MYRTSSGNSDTRGSEDYPNTDSLCRRAAANLGKFKANKKELLLSHLNSIIADIEQVVLKSSRISGRSSVEYDLLSLPISSNSKIQCEKLTDEEIDSLIVDVLAWIRKEGLTVKQQYEKCVCVNLRAKLIISWPSSSPSIEPSLELREIDRKKGSPILTTFPVPDTSLST